MPKDRRTITINGERKKYSYYVWHAHTGHWPMSPDEVIHHIDGDTLNDDFSNLRLMSDSEHKSLHMSGGIRTGDNNPFFGRTHSEESKAKMSAAKMGDKNPSWRGDDAAPQSKYARIWRENKRKLLQCPDDCPSKRFCDPSSCALESVREANAIAEALRGAE